jgi:hypothetical protein
VIISVYDREELLKGTYFGVWFISVPLQVAAHPEDAPVVLRSHIGGLCDWGLALDCPVSPVRADLEDLDALAVEAVPEIEFRPDMRWRSASLHEARHIAFMSL